MKVLIYSADIGAAPEVETYEGLKSLLGEKNVVLYKPNVHGSKGRTLPAGALSDSEFRERIDEFDCIIFLYSSFPDKDFEYALNRNTSSTKAYIDGVDDFFVRRIYNHPEIKYYMKRELYKAAPSLPYRMAWGALYIYEMHRDLKVNRKWMFTKPGMIAGVAFEGKYKKMRPFPITVVPRPARGGMKKNYDVSFMGHINSFDRLVYANALGRISSELGLKTYLSRDYLNPRPALSWKDYLRILQSSRAGLSTRGMGCDTYRYWEIPCYGTALLSQRTPQVIPDNFVDKESALYFSDRHELKSKIEKYIVKSDEWKEIARNGQRRFLKYHAPEKRAEYLLKTIRQ